jgi:hypothetical protein
MRQNDSLFSFPGKCPTGARSRSRVVTETGAVRHIIGSWIIGHHECIREMEITYSNALTPPIVHSALHAGSLLQSEILIRNVVRDRVLGESDHASLDRVIWLPSLAISPNNTQTCGRNSLGCDNLVRRSQRAPNTSSSWLPQDCQRRDLSNIVHSNPYELIPRVAIAFQSRALRSQVYANVQQNSMIQESVHSARAVPSV